jgi:NADH-quinone oxidoreductase subunit H
VNVFATGAAILLDPSLKLLAWIGIAEIAALVAITTAVARAPSPEEPAAHLAAGHGH